MALGPSEIVAAYLQRTGLHVDDKALAGMVANVDDLLTRFEAVSRAWAKTFPEAWARRMVRDAIREVVDRGLGLEESRSSREARC